MGEPSNGNAKLVTILFAVCMFLAGVVVTGVAGVIRGDYIGRDAAHEVEERLNRRIDDTLVEINRRLDRLDRRTEPR